jgi:hypothetical protein
MMKAMQLLFLLLDALMLPAAADAHTSAVT